MRIGADLIILRAMSDRLSTRVIVDIERGASTVSGQITVCDGRPNDFFGWLELIDGLERAARRQTPADPGLARTRGSIDMVPARFSGGDLNPQ